MPPRFFDGQLIKNTVKIATQANELAIIAALAFYNFFLTLFLGFPGITAAAAKAMLAIPVPVIATLTAELTSINGTTDRFALATRITKAIVAALGMNAFLNPLIFTVVTEAIELFQGEDKDAPVYISNEAAFFIISACIMFSTANGANRFAALQAQANAQERLRAGLTGEQTLLINDDEMPTHNLRELYENNINSALKSLFNRMKMVVTSRPAELAFSGVGGASVLHAVGVTTETILGVDLSSNPAYYARWALTILGLVAGLTAKLNNHRFNKTILELITAGQVFSLMTSYLSTIFLSDQFSEEAQIEQILLMVLLPLMTLTTVYGSLVLQQPASQSTSTIEEFFEEEIDIDEGSTSSLSSV